MEEPVNTYYAPVKFCCRAPENKALFIPWYDIVLPYVFFFCLISDPSSIPKLVRYPTFVLKFHLYQEEGISYYHTITY